MLAISSFCVSRLSSRDATRRMSATELLLRSYLHNPALKWLSHRRVPPRGAAGSTSRRDAAQQEHLVEGRELLLPRSISPVAAEAAP